MSSDQLEAFAVVAREAHFSKAAGTLGITQSALSLRIQKLEDFIGATLFIRGRAGVKLTDAGQELVRYSTLKSSLEADVLGKISGSDQAHQVQGLIRVGGFSSVMRSMVLPAVSEVLHAHPKVSLKLVTRELDELPAALQRAEVDFLILDRKLDFEGVESIFLGNEVNVLAQSKAHSKTKNVRTDVFLDHDEQDQTTFKFFKAQSSEPREIRRIYLDDIYGIIDGVTLGLGRAVLPKHLVEGISSIEVDLKFKAIESPVFLNYYRQPYYSRLHALVQESLEGELKSHLKFKPSKRMS
jgi:DNA-binding transcriptional LysR family regulator